MVHVSRLGYLLMTSVSIMYDGTKNVEDYLKKKDVYATPFQTTYSMKLSYHLLKQVFAEDGCTVPCSEGVDGIVLNEACTDLYDAASKCSKLPEFVQSPGSDVSITRNSNIAHTNTICGEKVFEEPIAEEVSSTSIHDDDGQTGEIQGNIYGLDGEDDAYDEESKVGTYEYEASATHVYDRINRFIVLIISIVFFIFV